MIKSVKKREPLHLQSYRVIKEGITQGQYDPRERITEVGISIELGVSRGTAREAIKMLLQDGLIVQQDGCLKIFEPTLEKATELYLCRERLESLAAKLATRNITSEEKKKLSFYLTKAKLAIKERDSLKLSKLNTDFHHLIIMSSRNDELLQLMNLISAKVSFIRNSLHCNYVRTGNWYEEHQEIAQAIFNNNEVEAEKLMIKHIKKDLEAINILFSKN